MKDDIVFEPLPGYSEPYFVEYTVSSGEHPRRKTITVFAKTKNVYSDVTVAIIRTFKLKPDEIRSIRYL